MSEWKWKNCPVLTHGSVKSCWRSWHVRSDWPWWYIKWWSHKPSQLSRRWVGWISIQIQPRLCLTTLCTSSRAMWWRWSHKSFQHNMMMILAIMMMVRSNNALVLCTTKRIGCMYSGFSLQWVLSLALICLKLVPYCLLDQFVWSINQTGCNAQ